MDPLPIIFGKTFIFSKNLLIKKQKNLKLRTPFDPKFFGKTLHTLPP